MFFRGGRIDLFDIVQRKRDMFFKIKKKEIII